MTSLVTRTLTAALAVLLTLSCLGPLFAPAGGWVVPVLVAVAVAVGCGTIGRQLPVPAVTGTIVSLAGGLLVVTAVCSPGNAYLGFIPSSDSLGSLQGLISSGFSDIQTYAPPVYASGGLVLLTTGGVYLVTLLVDLLAVTVDRPLIAGVPLLGLLAVPAAFQPGGLGLVHVVLAALGWLLLLAVDGRDRQLRWGRPLGRSGSVGDGRRSAGSADRRRGGIGLRGGGLFGGTAGRLAGVSVVAGLVLPALIPALHGGIFHPPSHCCGGGQARVVEPLVTLDQQLTQQTPEPLLTVITNSPQYLRFTALDNYNDDGFSLVTSQASTGRVNGRLSSGTPGLGPLVATQQVQDTITVDPTLAEKYLPLPYSPVSVTVPGNWQLIPGLRTVFSPQDTTAGLTFTVTAEVPSPTQDQLRLVPAGYAPAQTAGDVADALAPDLVVPASVPHLLDSVADKVTAPGKTAYDKLFLLEKYFTAAGGYVYDLQPGLSAGAAGITQFLTDRRQGFCQQFATVFTLMARHLHLPARVAVGFTPGRALGGGEYEVGTGDAHAWPEVWFTGIGWVRFEPTPRSDIAPYQPAYLRPSIGRRTALPKATPAPTPTATAPVATARRLPDGEQDSKPSVVAAARPGGVSLPILLSLAGALVIVLLGALPGLVRAWVRRRRVARIGKSGHGFSVGEPSGEDGRLPAAPDPAAAHAAWDELIDTMIDLGMPVFASETPRATARRLTRLFEVDDAAERPAGVPLAGAADRCTAAPSRSGALAVLDRPVAATAPEVIGRGTPGRRADQRRAESPAHEPPADSLLRLRAAKEAASYGRPGATSTSLPRLADDIGIARRALLAQAGRGSRLRATVFPRSTISAAFGSSRLALRTAAERVPRPSEVTSRLSWRHRD